MKTILALSILFSVIALPALGELTIKDIEKIDAKIQASEDRIKEYINIKNESIDKKLSLVTTFVSVRNMVNYRLTMPLFSQHLLIHKM